MTEKLRAQLASLQSVAPMLNKATDEATAVVKSVDAFLKSLNLGLTSQSDDFADIPLTRDDPEVDDDIAEGMDNDNRYVKTSALRYARVNGEFCIHVAHTILVSYYPPGCDEDWKPVRVEGVAWQSCPREVKLKAVVALPSLLANIEAQARKLATDANEASGFTRTVLESLAERDEADPIRDATPKSASKVKNSK